MTCLEVRREIAAVPSWLSDTLRRHVTECEVCARALWREQSFDRRLREALSVSAPDALAERLLLAQTTRHRRRFLRLIKAVAIGNMIALRESFGLGQPDRAGLNDTRPERAPRRFKSPGVRRLDS